MLKTRILSFPDRKEVSNSFADGPVTIAKIFKKPICVVLSDVRENKYDVGSVDDIT